MGWFSNTNNPERMANNIIIDSYGQKLGGKHALLTQQKKETSEAAEALSTLIAMGNLTTPVLTSQVRQVARELLDTKTKINDHLEGLNLRLLGTEIEMEATAAMLENYDVPRARREINMSGKDMVKLAVQGMNELAEEIPALKQEHNPLITQAREIAKQALNIINNK